MVSPNLSQSSSYRSQQKTIADLSLLEKFGTIPSVLAVLANVFGTIFTSPVYSKESKPSGGLFRNVALAAIRTFVTNTSVRQQHYISLPTDDAYLAACKKRGFTPNSEVLEDGTRAHWIGDSKAEKLILNFHGGGYCIPASPEMFEFMFQIVSLLGSQGKPIAVLMLSYDLAPTAVYPRQLQQAATLLNHVLLNLKVAPSNIVLTGDSAGGNLVTGLLSHISHPHPSTTVPIPKVDLQENFRAAVLISPWVTFDTRADSFTRNANKDCIGAAACNQWSSAWLGSAWPHGQSLDNYNQPAIAPESWWADLKVEKILVVAGGEEVFVDEIKKFAENLIAALGAEKVESVVVQGEYHDQANLDLQFGYREEHEGQQAKLIKSWIGSKL